MLHTWYRQAWAIDFEYIAADGEVPVPVCMVAIDLIGGGEIRLWQDELAAPPFDLHADDVCFIAYHAPAELGCFEVLGWPMPPRVYDLHAEFKRITNGGDRPFGASLLGALEHFGITHMSRHHKERMRDLILSGGPWSEAERAAILDYCREDVAALGRLWPVMARQITRDEMTHGGALLRGRYMGAVARMELGGVPIDAELLERLAQHWESIKRGLMDAINPQYGVYQDGHFSAAAFGAWCGRTGIQWPRLPSGALALDSDTFKDQAKVHPEVADLHDLRVVLGQLRQIKLAVGKDGRNRTSLFPLGSKTGRNQPSTAKFIFGPAVWLRGLIKPAPGYGLAYLDWKSQEIGIAAALSGDARLWEAYQSGDVYLAFAKAAGMAPRDATKDTHDAVRQKCKAIVLGTNYGMAAPSIAAQAGIHIDEARTLLMLHRDVYRDFWRWSDSLVNAALMGAQLRTRFGWTWQAGRYVDPNPRSIQNWPMQSNGAEMLRLACSMATERDITVCAPIHDALLIEAPLDLLEADVEATVQIMQDASEMVMGDGLVLGVDRSIVRYPDRYADKRGRVMWPRVMALLEEAEK
jgi:DNA polymerase I